jgi:hypothetical protein
MDLGGTSALIQVHISLVDVFRLQSKWIFLFDELISLGVCEKLQSSLLCETKDQKVDTLE